MPLIGSKPGVEYLQYNQGGGSLGHFPFIMVNLSDLCHVCKAMLDSSLHYNSRKPHHETLESFQKAALRGCYFCTIVWKGCGVEHRDPWQHRNPWQDHVTFWQPMYYYAYREYCDTSDRLDDSDRLGLSITYQDPQTGFASSSDFHLISYGGEFVISHPLFSKATGLHCLDDEFQTKFTRPPLEDTTSSLSTLEKLRGWCLSCRADHSKCDRFVQQNTWCPTRLVDIGDHSELDWKLHQPLKSGCPRPVYITLSYRWGSDDDFKLTKDKLRSGFHGRIEDLPQTFKDAVQVARLFSVRYLWVDRLCIIQDSKHDWDQESIEMRRVYTNSFCNIAASTSTSPKGGLFRSRNPENTRPGCVMAKSPTSYQMLYHVFDRSYLARQVFAGPLHRRGWVFQERILAPRTIHFAEDQVIWECFTELKCEAFPAGMPFMRSVKSDFDFMSDTPGTGAFKKTPLDLMTARLWDSLVEQYTQCSFTRESDRLVAFSGIALLFQEITGDKYVAGLWRSRLVEHLDWRATAPTLRSSDEYCAPSWSWASISGPVEPARAIAEPEVHVTISDVQIQSSMPNSMGLVLSGSIVMEGILIQALCTSAVGHSTYVLEVGPRRVKGWMQPDALGSEFTKGHLLVCLPLLTIASSEIYITTDGGETPAIEVSRTHLLVLEALHPISNVYRRVGRLVMGLNEWIDGSEVTINSDGTAVYSKDGKTSEITLI